MNRVKDKVAIVTGAAQGIGQAISQVLAEEGAWVLITDINGELAGGHEMERLAHQRRSNQRTFLPESVLDITSRQRVIACPSLHERRRENLRLQSAHIAANGNDVTSQGVCEMMP